jgi:hypothetical protein
MPGQADYATGNLQVDSVIKITNSFAIVNANTSAQQTVTVLGLAVGDLVYVSKTTFQAGLIVASADVSAKDTLRVTFGNLTAGGITPTVGDTYTVSVIRLSNPAQIPGAFI